MRSGGARLSEILVCRMTPRWSLAPFRGILPQVTCARVDRSLAVWLAGVLLTGLGMPDAAAGAFPGRNGELAYHGRASETGVIYVRRSDGSPLRRLRVPGRPSDPRYSPLGRRIAFTSSGAIWVTGSDGSDTRRVTPPGLRARNPAWSPDGSALAFAGGSAGSRDIYRIGLDGNDLRRVTFASADEHEPAWSSRGLIAYVRRTRRGAGDLFTVGPVRRRPRRLTRGRADDGSPTWSPGGTRIAFTRGRAGRRQLYVIRPDGGGVRRITRTRHGVTAPAWSPDGRQIAFGIGRRGRRALAVVRTDGRRLRRVVSGSADVRSVGWQPRPEDAYIAAAGDVACDPTQSSFAGGLGTARSCRALYTSDLLLEMDLWAVLVLGDLQYSDGLLWKYLQAFDPTWGRVKSLLRPALGNHEYLGDDAASYFDYFNGPGQADGPAGPRGAGYYSFDVGDWHIVALNSQCGHRPAPPGLPGCEAGSAQEQWLRADLAAHPTACTLAYWHHPLVSSRLGVDEAARPLWEALAEAGVDVVLTGHDHAYERFAPLDAAGQIDYERGIRQFVVGTGGKSHQRARSRLGGSEVRNSRVYGVLQLRLRPSSYHWRFVPEAGGRFTDAGARSCH
jgi:acid phosphatase type 7